MCVVGILVCDVHCMCMCSCVRMRALDVACRATPSRLLKRVRQRCVDRSIAAKQSTRSDTQERERMWVGTLLIPKYQATTSHTRCDSLALHVSNIALSGMLSIAYAAAQGPELSCCCCARLQVSSLSASNIASPRATCLPGQVAYLLAMLSYSSVDRSAELSGRPNAFASLSTACHLERDHLIS